MNRPYLTACAATAAFACGFATAATAAAPWVVAPTLRQGFHAPPPAARPHAYWLWLNGHVDLPSATAELRAMQEAGLGGVLLFEMGARGPQEARPPSGPEFLSPAWTEKLHAVTKVSRSLGLQVDMSVISSWDLGGTWVTPQFASKALYPTEVTVTGGRDIDLELPFPPPENGVPLDRDGRPAFWEDVAVLAVRQARRLPGHSFVLKLFPPGGQELTEVVLDQGDPAAPEALAATMTPVREFSIAVSSAGGREADFTEVLRAEMPAHGGRVRFPLPAGTKGTHLRLTLLGGHDRSRRRWTLAEFEARTARGVNVAANRAFLRFHTSVAQDGATTLQAPMALAHREWNVENLNDGENAGPTGVFVSAGMPPFDLSGEAEVIDVTRHVDRRGRLRWSAPAGEWTLLRYVCTLTGQRLRVPTPASDGLASDLLSAAATRSHMQEVLRRLRREFGEDLKGSGITNFYLASYEVIGGVWSPGFAGEFKRRRGYDLTRFVPAIFGARVDDESTTERFRFDYQKTLGEVIVDSYYRTAREAARSAGLAIKAEGGGPGPPVHNPPVDALLALGALDGIQGEFWPFWNEFDGLWVVKETASAGHIYGKPIVHMEAFTSYHHWAEGPQDLKASADRAFCEGANHLVWHTWTHQPPESGVPGWAYYAGTHLNTKVTWWPMARPFIDYLARCSFLLQRGHFVADVLYYYGDGGSNFVRPRQNPASLGPGYDYDFTNADVLLNRLTVVDGRLRLPDGTSYGLLVLPDREDIHPAVLAKIEELVSAGAQLLGRRPVRASGLEGGEAADRRVREIAGRLWGDLDGQVSTSRIQGRGGVFLGVSERAILATRGLTPDFTASPALDFTHRRDPEGEIYFVRNKSGANVSETALFRTREGAQVPELWDPVRGTIARAPGARSTPRGVEVPLDFAAHGSVFVVFRERSEEPIAAPLPAGATGVPEPLLLDGAWRVDFSSLLPAPPPLVRKTVGPWSDADDPAHRYFSGTGTYRQRFTLPPGWRAKSGRVGLDLGNLWAIGDVTLNGQSLGILWTPPFRVDCTSALQDGENDLAIAVANTWHNRLVGDAQAAGGQPRTSTNIAHSFSRDIAWRDLPPIKSGLFGPVRLVPLAPRAK
jgi:hypothetical protein